MRLATAVGLLLALLTSALWAYPHPYVEVRSRSSGVGVIYLVLPYGNAHDPQGKEGLSHLLEHLFFRGRGCSMSFKDELELIGAEYNAVTLREWTTFSFIAPEKSYPKLLRTIRCKLSHPEVSEREFLLERQVVINEMRLRSGSPAGRLRALMNQFLGLPQHEGGSPQTLSSITYDEAMSELRLRLAEVTLISNVPLRDASDWLKVTELDELPSRCQLSDLKLSPEGKVVRRELRYPTEGLVIVHRVPGLSQSYRIALALDVIGLTLAHRDSPLRALDGVEEVSVDYPTRCGPSAFIVSIRGDLDDDEALRAYRHMLESLASGPGQLRLNRLIRAMRGKLSNSWRLLWDDPVRAVDGVAYWVGLGAPGLVKDYPELIRQLSSEDIRRASRYLLETDTLIVELEE